MARCNGSNFREQHQTALGAQVEGNGNASKGSAMAAMGAQYQDATMQSSGRNEAQNQSAIGAIPERNWRKIRVQHQSARGHDQSAMGAQWGAISERNGRAMGGQRERNRSAMGA